jgi:hypothetical protein
MATTATVAIERTSSPERLTQSAYEQQLSMGELVSAQTSASSLPTRSTSPSAR